MVLTETGLAKVLQRIKSFIASQLNSKASAIHTHTVSDVSDLSTNYVTTNTTQTIDGNKNFSGTTNIKSLTINGTSCGDILTHNASEFVNVTGAQTVGGVKTFSNLRTYFGRDISFYSRAKYGKNLNPASTSYQYLVFSGNIISDGPTNQWDAGYIEQVVNTNGSSRARWRIQDTAENYVGFELWVDGNAKQIRPMNQNTTILGEPNRRWKDCYTNAINGLNPGALSLPSISSTGANAWIVLDTTDWVKNTAVSFAQKYTPLADGWLNVRVDNATMLAIAVGGNYMHQVIRSETANSLALLMPVFKNTEVAIMTGGNENLAYNRVTFYYCQGNV